MPQRVVAIRLKIPDNEAYTALATLQRLGVGVVRIERSEIYRFDDAPDPEALEERVRRDESIFNPNKHALTVLDSPHPRSGEAWIEELDAPEERYVGWRLFGADGCPADAAVVQRATECLLCNPAIERAIVQE